MGITVIGFAPEKEYLAPAGEETLRQHGHIEINELAAEV